MDTCRSCEAGEEVPAGGVAWKPGEGQKPGGGAWLGRRRVRAGVPGAPEPLPRGPAHLAQPPLHRVCSASVNPGSLRGAAGFSHRGSNTSYEVDSVLKA